MARFDPNRPDMSPYGFSCVRWNATRMPRSDRHNEIEINLLTGGRLLYLLGGRKVEVRAGQLTLFWACVPHQVLYFEGLTEYFVMTIPLAWFLQWNLPDPISHSVLQGRVIVEDDASAAAGDVARFDLWTRDLEVRSNERAKACALEVEARLHRLSVKVESGAEPSHLRRHSGPPDEDLSRAESLAGFIALHYTEPLSARRIAESVGLHPNYAMTLFNRTFGSTLISYVTQHRLSHAQRLLVTTTRPIIEIAFDSGFGSLSRFHKSFREAFGCTPREFRLNSSREK